MILKFSPHINMMMFQTVVLLAITGLFHKDSATVIHKRDFQNIL